jgi:hypothetical protein
MAESKGTRFDDLEEVYVAPLSELHVLRSSLEALGYDILLADENIKMWDPFVTGGSIFDSRLMAPASQAQEVRQTIQELKDQVPVTDEAAGDDASAEIEDIGRRIRWHSVIGLTAPVGIVSGARYLSRCRRLSVTPRGHLLTIVGIAWCVVQCGLFILMILWLTSSL